MEPSNTLPENRPIVKPEAGAAVRTVAAIDIASECRAHGDCQYLPTAASR